MSAELINWLLVILYIAAIAAVAIRRRNMYPRLLFNEWAIIVYCLLIPADLLLGIVLSLLLLGDGAAAQQHRANLFGLILLSLIACVVLGLLTLVLRWVVRTDLSEPK